MEFRRVLLRSRGVERNVDLNAALGAEEFPSGHCVFTCSTQLVSYQRMQFLGTKGRIEIKIPFNAPNDRPCELLIDDGRDVFGGGITTETIPTCDQYTIQGDAFSMAIRDGADVPVPLEDAIANMAVIEAVFSPGLREKRERAPNFQEEGEKAAIRNSLHQGDAGSS